ncbi:branched-chain amino acid ABC transporter substrate-binding protein [Achromobacter xylosoxidans]|uniref:ABC transporter substrate-binding protein n=1 Tax=Achromobacter aegrifaciens TaxID=1287736 RepID=UPI000D409153|nr:ABC transporter substrate-binding protein [Achromobacter aegrifaciens]MDQ1760144.1 ABC transporter substrate-binding protein [Achromobacter aegrifaciens]PTN42501.1 branched-chain amino acid ABC transporter substrate-binding protein [Achromobacter xylosoxidans]
MKPLLHPVRVVLVSCALLSCNAASADVGVGVILSLTGPAASLGGPAKNAIDLLPREIAGEAVRYIVLDDASDATGAARAFRRLVDEHNVDVVLGTSVTPATLTLLPIAQEKKVPLMSLAAGAKLVEPMDAQRHWVFKVVQNENLMVASTVAHMQAAGVKTLGYIGFADAYGDSWLAEVSAQAQRAGIKLVASERYVKTDTSVTAQTLKLLAARPDAVIVAASGTPGALPQKSLRERGYAGRIYQTYGIANREFLRIAGKDAEGALFAVGPVVVASQLDQANPIRAVSMDLTQRYEAAHGKDSMSVFAANAWDAGIVLQQALKTTLPKARPGTPEFRAGLRDALEATRDAVTSQGVSTMSPTDHVGYDERAAVMVQIKDGAWRYVK